MEPSANKKPLRVVMILGSLPPMPVGGAEVQAIELCKQLNKIGIETEVLTFGKIWNKKKDVYKGIPFIRLSSILDLFTDVLSLLKSKKPATATKIVYDDKSERTREITGKVWIGMISRYSLFYINCLVYLWLRRKKFDIIHAHMMEWPAFTAVKLGKKLRKPVVVKDSTMNGLFSILRYPDGINKQKEIAGYAWCVAMTKMIRENLIKGGVNESRIVSIPNGIEVIPMPVKKAMWQNKVIFVGNLTQQPAKGIDILLFAWKKVIEKVPAAMLELIGHGDLEAYKKFTGSENLTASVNFVGRQSNVKERLLNADVFVLPSRREGMSNALMEAMMCGMPVVATQVSGTEDLVENNISGMLVPVSDIQQLSDALIYMLQHPDEAIEMGKRAYDSVASKCDIKVVSEKYNILYQKTMETA